jgi:hypothetical protein
MQVAVAVLVIANHLMVVQVVEALARLLVVLIKV